MRPRRLLTRLRNGRYENVAFSDAVALVRALGFQEVRVRGAHHLFRHPEIQEMLNLQARRGTAKAYQLRQVVELIDGYDLRLEDR